MPTATDSTFVSPRPASKSWLPLYPFRKRRPARGLGSFDVVSRAEARRKAEEAARIRHDGDDPKHVWSRAIEPGVIPTFGEMTLEHIKNHSPSWRNAKHAQPWRSTLQTYGAPIWDRPVDLVTTEDVYDILKPIWSTKAETAERVRGRIEAVLDAAKARKFRSGENPATLRGNLAPLLPKRRKSQQKHHAVMPYDEVGAFVTDLRLRPGLAARALELTILTAARTGEVLGAQWAEIDLDRGLWIIPADRMKAAKAHRIPLSAPAVKLLKALPKTGEFVFPGQKRGTHLSSMSMENVLRRMKVKPFTVHGFRSSFRDWAAEQAEYPRELAEMALAHAVGSEVERAYLRTDGLERRRNLMSDWADHLDGAANPKADPKSEGECERIGADASDTETRLSI